MKVYIIGKASFLRSASSVGLADTVSCDRFLLLQNVKMDLIQPVASAEVQR